MISVSDSSDSPDTISSDSEDIIIENLVSDSNDDSEKCSPSKPERRSSSPVYVQSRMPTHQSVTSTVKSTLLEARDALKALAKDIPSEAKLTTIITAPKTFATGTARSAIVGSAPNGMVTARKVVSTPGTNVTYVRGLWQGDTRKVVLAPVKRASQEIHGARVILPGTNPQSQATVTALQGTSGTGSVNLLIPQGSKQLNKGYIVSPNAVGNRGTVSILPRNSLYIDGAGGGQTKIVSANFIKPRDGRIITTTSLRPVSMVNSSGGRLITASNLPACYNIIAMSNKPRSALSVKTATSNVNTATERRVLIGNPSGQLKLVPQEAHKKSDLPDVLSLEKPQHAVVKKDLTEANSGVSCNDSLPPFTPHSENTSLSCVPANDSPTIIMPEIKEGVTQNPPMHSKTKALESSPSPNFQNPIESTNKRNIENERIPEDPRRKQEDVFTIEDDAEEGPPEKQSALRKAKILSFPKPKAKASLLNGSFPDAPMLTSKSSLIAPERVRKRKDNHKAAIVEEPPQKITAQSYENIKPIPGAENQHPLRAIRWYGNGSGILPGSAIKLTYNEYGMIEVQEDLLASKVEYYKDSNGEVRVKTRDPAEIYCCSICSCYGLLSEFFNENFCSVVCWETMNAQQDAIVQKMEECPTPIVPYIPPTEVEPKKRKKQPNLEVENEEENDEPATKVKKTGGPFAEDDSNSSCQKSTETTSKAKSKVKAPSKPDKSEGPAKPLIKVKSMDSLAGSPVSGRQLRTRDSPATTPSKKISKFIVGQDLEGVTSEDDEKIKGEQIDPFPWSDYLLKTESKAAWIKLFSGVYPSTSPNLFKIGFKLEAIDPERQSLFSAATISDVQGHRIKIHFDGYSNKYDFWTNIDSPNIFPCGFCERHQIPLQPPAGFKKNFFSWQNYHNTRKCRPAPLPWFHSYRLNNTSTNMFRNGMKLEAVDKKNTQLICVSTVAGVIDNRILVHFDSWSDVYDYWVEASSPYIHPVGWCEERNRELTPPNGYNPKSFSWATYLRITKSEAAPAAAFTLRPPKEFKRFTKLEAIDKRSPHILRVATIKEVLPYQIKIAFDGFPDHFGYWTDDDSPDIHPVNWGLKTGHPVAGPPEIRQIHLSRCPTPGCIGDGNFKGLMAEFHSTPDECPYTTQNLMSESPLQDRLSSKTTQKKKPPGLGQETNSESDDNADHLWKFMDAAVERSTAKGRVSADGTMIKTPNIRPPHQTFRRIVDSKIVDIDPLQNKEVEDAETLPSKRNQKRSLERRTSDRNIKAAVTPRLSSQSDKGTTGAQAVSPIKGANVMSDDRSKKSSQPLQDNNDTFDRIRVSSDDRGLHRDVALWNAHKCLEKIGELGPKFQATFSELNINGGKLLMMNESDLQYKGLLTVPESKALFNLISELRKEASLGLDLWKKVERV